LARRLRSDASPLTLVLLLTGTLGALLIVSVALITVGALARSLQAPTAPPGSPGLPDFPTPSANLPASSPSPTFQGNPGEPAGHIVYTCFIDGHDEICLIDARGENRRQLTRQGGTEFYGAISPDGAWIVFSSRRHGQFDILMMTLEGGSLRRLSAELGNDFSPEVSPDGTRIVFTSTADGKQGVYVMSMAGFDARRLTDNPLDELDPTWSPDGSQIAFSANWSGTNELYLMEADGSNIRQVTRGSDQRDGGRSDWSPDGSVLAFYAGPVGNKDLYTVPVSCAEQGGCGPEAFTRLTHGGNNKAPAYSPDGGWIAFASNLDGDNEIFIMRVDGSDLGQLTFNDSADWQPRWGP